MRLGLTVFLVWTLISLCQAAQYYFFFDPEDGPLTWTHALGLGFALWYSWGLLGVLIFRLSRRFPLGKHHWPSRLAVHTFACLAFAGVKIFIDYPIIRGLYCPRSDILTLPVFLRWSFTLVNVDRIRELQPLFHGDYVVILHDGSELTLSRTYRRNLPGRFGEGL